MSGEQDAIAAARFFAAAINHMQEGFDWDGCDLQDTCKKLGLTYTRPYDAETDSHMDAEDGDLVWVPTVAGTRLLALARSADTPTQVNEGDR